jgi:hypothetical protein
MLKMHKRPTAYLTVLFFFTSQATIWRASATRPIALGSVQDESHVLHLICLLKLHDIYDNYLLFGRPHTAGVSGMEDANHMHLLYATSAFFTRCFATRLGQRSCCYADKFFFFFFFRLCASLISSLTFYCCGG